MATIVFKIESGKRYVLIGTGYGAYKSERPGVLLGDLVPATTQGVLPMVCVCDASGKLEWIESRLVLVESLDGDTPKSILEQR